MFTASWTPLVTAFPCGVARSRRACRDTGWLQILSPLPSRIRLHPFFNLAFWETSQHSQWSLYDLLQLGARDEYCSSSLVLTDNKPHLSFRRAGTKNIVKKILLLKLLILKFERDSRLSNGLHNENTIFAFLDSRTTCYTFASRLWLDIKIQM